MSMLYKIVQTILNPKRTKFLLSLPFSGYLYDIDWFQSFQSFKPIRKGEPIPWLTYSFIDFLEPRLSKDLNILEFGSGNSTLFFSCRVKSVFSIEHDMKWIELLEKKISHNCKIINYSLSDERYENPISNGELFDVILVDGRKRVKCVLNCLDKLSPKGVIILDDSERYEYDEAVNFMLSKHFKKIDFWGISPGTFYNKCTTVFYRSENCLKI